MNRKLMALSLAIAATLTLAGCSTGSSAASNTNTAQGQAQGGRRGNQANVDPELQKLMQDQRQTQQQIEQLLQQIHTDAGLPAPANNDQQQAAPGQAAPGNGGQRNGGQGPRGGGNGGQGGGQGNQGAPAGQDLQAAKDLLNQEQQAGTDLVAKLTTFDGLAKDAAGNQKALKDAQTLFAPIEESLQISRGPGNNGGGRPMGFGAGNRTDLYKTASGKLDAAITQLKADLGK